MRNQIKPKLNEPYITLKQSIYPQTFLANYSSKIVSDNIDYGLRQQLRLTYQANMNVTVHQKDTNTCCKCAPS